MMWEWGGESRLFAALRGGVGGRVCGEFLGGFMFDKRRRARSGTRRRESYRLPWGKRWGESLFWDHPAVEVYDLIVGGANKTGLVGRKTGKAGNQESRKLEGGGCDRMLCFVGIFDIQCTDFTRPFAALRDGVGGWVRLGGGLEVGSRSRATGLNGRGCF